MEKSTKTKIWQIVINAVVSIVSLLTGLTINLG